MFSLIGSDAQTASHADQGFAKGYPTLHIVLLRLQVRLDVDQAEAQEACRRSCRREGSRSGLVRIKLKYVQLLRPCCSGSRSGMVRVYINTGSDVQSAGPERNAKHVKQQTP